MRPTNGPGYCLHGQEGHIGLFVCGWNTNTTGRSNEVGLTPATIGLDVEVVSLVDAMIDFDGSWIVAQVWKSVSGYCHFEVGCDHWIGDIAGNWRNSPNCFCKRIHAIRRDLIIDERIAGCHFLVIDESCACCGGIV